MAQNRFPVGLDEANFYVMASCSGYYWNPCTLPRMGKNRVQSMVEHLHFASDFVSRRA